MENDLEFPEIPPRILSGRECITGSDGKTIASVSDYWRWAHSDLIDNTERGVLAEYIVARAMGTEDLPRSNWASYDLIAGQIRIEVKASGYIQSWGQKGLSKIQFGIPKTVTWNHNKGRYEGGKTRHADVYVFCLLKQCEQERLNPLDLSQWEFYVVPTELINERFGERESITLQCLQEAGIRPMPFEKIRHAVLLIAPRKSDFG